MWTEKLSLEFNFNNSEAKAVVLEILTVLNRTVVQFSVAYDPNPPLSLPAIIPINLWSVVLVK